MPRQLDCSAGERASPANYWIIFSLEIPSPAVPLVAILMSRFDRGSPHGERGRATTLVTQPGLGVLGTSTYKSGLPKFNISKTSTILSQVYNFTVAGSSDGHTPCHFVKCVDRRMVRGLISTGIVLPMVIFSFRVSRFWQPRPPCVPNGNIWLGPFNLVYGLNFYSLLLPYCASSF